MRIKGLAILALAVCLTGLPKALAQPVSQMPHVTAAMLSADFWVNQLSEPDRILLEPQAIQLFNQEMRGRQKSVLYDLLDYPETLTRRQVVQGLKEYSIPRGTRYSNGKVVTREDYDNLLALIDAASIPANVAVRFGLTVRQTNIRTFPTQEESLSSPDEHEHDHFQESELWPVEPVVVLHESSDKQWYFIQCRNYRGWVQAQDVALAANREQWLQLVRPQKFLVVTANRLLLGSNPYNPALSRLELPMGTRLPIAQEPLPAVVDGMAPSGNYIVSFPLRTLEGGLAVRSVLIPYSSDVSEGYLAYTIRNVLQQAFKMQGERYGWGGQYDSRDCSSFVMSVFRTMGIELPRNADQQENSSGQQQNFDGKTWQQKQQALASTRPGALLHMGGHVMLYLGQAQGKYYVIHDFPSYGDLRHPNGNGYTPIALNQVIVSELSLPLKRTGVALLAAVTTVNPVLPKSAALTVPAERR